MEETKTIDGYTFYTDGRIWSKHKNKFLEGDNSDKRGYNRVEINGKKIGRHKIIAQVFIPNPENKPEVHHIDGNPSNNNVDNLMWVTRKEHMDIHEDKRQTSASVAKYTKVYQYSLEGRFVREWNSIKEAEDTLGIKGISKSCRKGIMAGGFQWEYEKHDSINQLKSKGERCADARSIPIEMCSMDWEHEAYFPSGLECERETGIPSSNIRKVCLGERKSAGGHRFRYKEPQAS